MSDAVSVSTRAQCTALDAADPLASLRDEFALPEGIVYLDGNSLGALPRASAARLQQVIAHEWGVGLIRSWNDAGWIDLSRRVGDRIAPLIGARPGEVVVGDSTSVNLYKTLATALLLMRRDAPERRVIVSERGNFPTDLYIAESLAQQHGMRLVLVDAPELPAQMTDELAVLVLTHVDYRSGCMHEMAAINRAAHAAGGMVIWDLAHSAGAVPVAMHGEGDAHDPADAAADFAIGCGYKYLNGGPGAPAFLWVHPRHTRRMDTEQLRQPLAGWLGHRAPFEFTPDYQPAEGNARFVCGTPPVLSLAALDTALDVFEQAASLGGMAALRAKSIALSTLFIARIEATCPPGLTLATPRDASLRGSQVSFAHPDAYAVMQALIARGVIGDFRAPDLLRFGFTPLYTRFVDVWDAAEAVAVVLASGEWRDPRFAKRAAVT